MKRPTTPRSLVLSAMAFIILLSFIFLLQSVRAATWSWTNPETPLTIADMTEVGPTGGLDICAGNYQTVETIVNIDVAFNDMPRQTDCLVGETSGFRLLSHRSLNLTIQFTGDAEAHTIFGIDCRFCT